MNSTDIKTKAILAALLAACLAAPAAAGGPGSAGVQVLKSDISPRSLGMGGAFVAVADDPYAAAYNPAGIGQLYLPEATAMYQSGFDDASLQYLAFGLPLPIEGFAGFDKPGLAVSAMFAGSGRFVYNKIDSGSGDVTTRSMDAESTRVLGLTYGEKIFAGDVNLEGYSARIEQHMGLSVKYVGSELLETYSASGVAFDGGWLVKDLNSGLALGAAVSNFGGSLKYYKENTPTPTILRLGLSYAPPTVMSQSLLLSTEADLYLQEKLKSLRGGLEYRFQEHFFARLGYRGGEENKGAALGLGIRYENFALDFAMTMGNEVFNTSQVSFSYKFSGWRTGDYKRKKPQYQAPRPADAKPAARPSGEQRKEPAGRPAAKPKKDSDFFWIY